MSNSTRRGGNRRVDVIELFSPRRSGPWHLFRPLRTRYGFALVALVLLWLLVTDQLALAGTVVVLDLVLVVASFAAVWHVVGLLIRARAELVIATSGVLADWWLSSLITALWAGIVLVDVVVVGFILPWTRPVLAGRVWCVLDRHRLRRCLRQTKIRTMNLDGSLPLLLWARPTKIGERVWLWLPAGSSAQDMADACEYIAPACWAREARVQRVRRVTTIVAIDIIRRDPLAARRLVTSPLRRLTTLVTGGRSATEGTGVIAPASIVDITSTEVDIPTPTRVKTTKTDTPEAFKPRRVLVPDENDFSDYID